MNGAATAESSAQGTRPTVLPVMTENIPEELKRLPHWVTWKLERRDDRWTKPPFQVDGNRHAKANDPRTWGSFEDAMSTYEWGTVDGVGFEPSAGAWAGVH
jgi:putative DNA primase/helicase